MQYVELPEDRVVNNIKGNTLQVYWHLLKFSDGIMKVKVTVLLTCFYARNIVYKELFRKNSNRPTGVEHFFGASLRYKETEVAQ